MQTAIAAILIFGLLIFVHEFGHFVVAKLSGMRVEEFSIGMGPTIFSTQKGETKYVLGLLPIGGFVRITGEYMEDFDDGTIAEDDPRRYPNRPLWHRMLFICAGSAMNYLTAIVIFAIVIFSIGMPVPTEDAEAIISRVVENSVASAAGFEAGDKVVNVNGTPIAKWTELTEMIQASNGQPMNLTVVRDGQQLQLTATAQADAESSKWLLGIQSNTYTMAPVSVFKAVQFGGQQTVEVTKMMVQAVGNLVTGQVSLTDDEEGLTGPVGIVKIIDEGAKQGVLYLLELTALLSVNLGLLNILPVPALDGSKLVFLAIEAVRGKPVDSSKENAVHLLGFALLMGLMIFVTYKDILRLFTR